MPDHSAYYNKDNGENANNDQDVKKIIYNNLS